ncbi:phage tail sheath subtilisin-like domain-containing protein [Microbacterium karelineae]|uniref:phage tail sheath subtilisin-like domain-containing protein n=1 Tax=Microbacterium karelineae TaxID=2654283 RepID=UPI0012EA9C63|nr:phage tail sheath subtilisin-like domain-containing protein [Microbacterium karelineae]
MVRPQVTVNISGELPVASLPTETGTLFFVYAGPTGPLTPTRVTSVAEAEAADVPTATALWIGDALTQGAPEVIVVRAEAVDPGAVTETEWNVALDLLTPSHGPGQVATPGVADTAAYTALLAHVDANPHRVAFLDVGEGDDATTISTAAAAIAATAGAERAGVFGPWVSVPGSGSARTVPASVIAAGLAARGDATVGNSNNAPIFDQGRGAGSVSGALGVVTDFGDTDVDTLYDAGVNVFRDVLGVVTLTGWKSVGTDPVWRQLNIGRLTMEVSARISALMYQYLGSPIDGQGILLSQVEGDIAGYLLDLYTADALFGATADDAFTVIADFSNNTPTTIANGEVHADVAITASTAAEQIVINVVTSLAS